MFENILIIGGMNPNFDIVLKSVCSLKKLGSRKCTLFHCISSNEANETVSSSISELYTEELKVQEKMLVEEGYEVKLQVTSGDLREELKKEVELEDFSLIVSGASERSLLGTLLEREAAYSIMAGISLPLLLVRVPSYPSRKVLYQTECNLHSHILFPVDYTESTGTVMGTVSKMAESGADRITLMHVIENNHHKHEKAAEEMVETRDDRETLQRMAEDLKKGKAAVDVMVRTGSPAEEIIRASDETGVTLIVMGSKGKGLVREMYLGSVSHKVARHSSVSVMLMPV